MVIRLWFTAGRSVRVFREEFGDVSVPGAVVALKQFFGAGFVVVHDLEQGLDEALFRAADGVGLGTGAQAGA